MPAHNRQMQGEGGDLVVSRLSLCGLGQPGGGWRRQCFSVGSCLFNLKHREISGPSPQNLHQHKHGVCVQSPESLGSAAYSHALQAVSTCFKHLQWVQVVTFPGSKSRPTKSD